MESPLAKDTRDDSEWVTLFRPTVVPGWALRLPSGDLGRGDISPGEREGVKSDQTRDTW